MIKIKFLLHLEIDFSMRMSPTSPTSPARSTCPLQSISLTSPPNILTCAKGVKIPRECRITSESRERTQEVHKTNGTQEYDQGGGSSSLEPKSLVSVEAT